MIGVSLPFFNGLITGFFGGTEILLNKLKDFGVKSVELRAVRADNSPEKVLEAAELLWDNGFNVTVHGDIRNPENAVSDIFTPLSQVLKNLRQRELVVTVHPEPCDNVKVLTDIADYIAENNLPVKIALENNRLLPDDSFGDSVALVTQIVKQVNRYEIGICFDMGHFCWYSSKVPSAVLPDDFTKRIIHTHIHALRGGTTHFPLGENELPLKEYIKKFSFEYFGVYNIELEQNRFNGLYEPLEAFEISTAALCSALPAYAFVYDDIRENFSKKLADCFKIYENGSKENFALIQSSSYLFKSRGVNWAVDVALRNAAQLSDCRGILKEKMHDVDVMLITHAHADHFEYQTVSLLKDLNLKWVIPYFIYETAVQYGIKPENIIIAKPGNEIIFGDLKILPFESDHYRPGTENGVPELGYYVTGDGMPDILIPGDIRNYTPKIADGVGNVDALFAHIWLGDDNTRQKECDEKARLAAEYYCNFKPKTVIFGHLYEAGRTDEQMWRNEHALAVGKYITEIDGGIKCILPCAEKYILAKTDVLR